MLANAAKKNILYCASSAIVATHYFMQHLHSLVGRVSQQRVSPRVSAMLLGSQLFLSLGLKLKRIQRERKMSPSFQILSSTQASAIKMPILTSPLCLANNPNSFLPAWQMRPWKLIKSPFNLLIKWGKDANEPTGRGW